VHFSKKRLQKLAGILYEEKDIKTIQNDEAIGLFIMKSPFAPKGWDYDHIGFVLSNGKLKDMSGHRYDEVGEHPLPPVVYSFNEAEQLFKMPSSKSKATKAGLYKEKPLPFHINIPNEVVCNIHNQKEAAVNCGSFVKIVLYNNGIKSTKSNLPEDIFNSIKIKNKTNVKLNNLHEEKNIKNNPFTIKQFFGNNFQYTLSQYTVIEDGLAQYGVHYSNIKKWGINPDSSYFPMGVYFYYLDGSCGSNKGVGFATDRTWANIAKINNERMVILKHGNQKDFTKYSYETSINKLTKKYGDLPNPNKQIEKFKSFPLNIYFSKLANIILEMESSGMGSFNRLLHDAGYDGIVDYDKNFLPIENCQGVQTWPGGASLVESIPTPKRKPPNGDERLVIMLKRLKNQTNGSLQLKRDEIKKIISMLPAFYDKWDISDSKTDLIDLLIMKLDFTYADSKNWLNDNDYFGNVFYSSFERNPTTPKEYWKNLLHSADLGARLTAKDMLEEHTAASLPFLLEYLFETPTTSTDKIAAISLEKKNTLSVKRQ